MSATLHPGNETLVRAAAGHLALGPRLVVAAHLSACAHCRAAVGRFEAVGGAVLESTPAEPVVDGRAPDVAAGHGLPVRPPLGPDQAGAPSVVDGYRLPVVLSGFIIGRALPLSPKIRVRRIRTPSGLPSGAVLLAIAPGAGIPDHGHSGREFAQVLRGSFADARGVYRAGDFVEADGGVRHSPRTRDEACLCLFAMDGRFMFSGLLGRLLGLFAP